MPIWVLRALEAIDGASNPTGNPLSRLNAFLDVDPPNNDTFLDLLQHLCDRENNHTTSNPLARCMLEWLDDEHRGGRFPQRISWIQVFRQSVTKFVTDPNWAYRDPIFDCASSTKVIWDQAGSKLYKDGAIHVCAQFGLDALLHLALEKLSREEDVAKRMEILFKSHFGTLTALGAAIRYRRVLCVDTILTRVPMDYLGRNFGNRSRILQNEEFFDFPLHQILAWTEQDLIHSATSEEDLLQGLQQTEEILKGIITMVPSCLAVHDDQGRPPYFIARQLTRSCRNRFPGRTTPFDQLEKLLREQIFNSLGNNPEQYNIEVVMRALYCRNERGKEVCLDLTDLNHDPQWFMTYVDELRQYEVDRNNNDNPATSWLFEDTLLDLVLPCNCSPQSVRLFLQWLRGQGVITILRVKLPDLKRRFETRFVREDIVDKFRVVELDWLRMDLDLVSFSDENTGWTRLQKTLSTPWRPLSVSPANRDISPDANSPSLTCLHLYTDSEYNITNLRQIREIGPLKSVKKVKLHLVLPFIPSGRPSDNEERKIQRNNTILRLRADYSVGNISFETDRDLSWDQFMLKPVLYTPEQEACNMRLLNDLRPCHNFLEALQGLTEEPINPTLRRCWQTLKDGRGKGRVKIALLDNGVDPTNKDLASAIVAGRSFVRAGTPNGPLLPWAVAADAHGTQMACLIRMVNPCCRLYPARVASFHHDVDANAAAKAIEWAIDHNVDIISISWVVRFFNVNDELNSPLVLAITRAVQRNILIFCSTADVGAQSGHNFWPVNLRNIIAVSASDRMGHPRLQSDHDVHVMFEGEKIQVEGPKYIKEKSKLALPSYASGSSVSTALAAGLGSLCLFLARMANESDILAERFCERTTMLAVFREMQVSPRDKVIAPSQLFANFGSIIYGTDNRPAGLDRFEFSYFEPKINTGLTTRRARSAGPAAGATSATGGAV